MNVVSVPLRTRKGAQPYVDVYAMPKMMKEIPDRFLI